MKHVAIRVVAAAAIVSACGTAMAQTSSEQSGTQSTGGVRAPLAPRIPSLGGVKSQIPGPTGISRKGTLLNRKGTLLPPAPVVNRPPQQPGPRPGWPIQTGRPDLDGRPIIIGSGYVGHPGVVTSGTGVVIDGMARDDKWKLRFHLGSGYTYSPWWKPWKVDHRWFDNHHHHHAYWWNSNYSYWSYPPPVVYGPVDAFVATGVNPAAIYAAAYAAMNPAPSSQTVPAVREPTPLERADALLMYGEPKAAAEAYRKYLEDAPGDATPMRSLAIALLQQRRFDEAVAVMAMAYEREPRLARTPIDPSFFEDSANLRKNVNAMVTYANRVNSASSWLTVATLMQAEKRDDVALRMIERAKGLGLNTTVADQFTDVLKKSN